MKKKSLVYTVVSIIVLVFCIVIFTYKYNKVNSENVTKLTIDKYDMGENVELQDFNIRINSLREKYANKEEVFYELELELQNKSNDTKSFEHAINEMKVESVYAQIIMDKEDNFVALKSNSTKTYKIQFGVDKKSYDALKDKGKFEYYISNKFYMDQCKDKFLQDKEYYKKSINLSVN